MFIRYLVGSWATHLKNMQPSKWVAHLPQFSGWKQSKYLRNHTLSHFDWCNHIWNHHLVIVSTPRDFRILTPKKMVMGLNQVRNLLDSRKSPPPCSDAEGRYSSWLDVSENSGTSNSSIFNRVFHYKPSVLGYPYFWKHPIGGVGDMLVVRYWGSDISTSVNFKFIDSEDSYSRIGVPLSDLKIVTQQTFCKK